ncbi:MAG: amidohydrolase family protein [Armatimonadetes bacterium]|nr:amidohydrolase family protein [Armatimonadota bacterium]
MPGLVNGHTHLELTSLRGLADGLKFTDWILEVTQAVLSLSAEFFVSSAAEGALDCLQGGVTCIADHSTFGFSSGAMAAVGLRGTVYREMFCPDPEGDYSAQMDAVAHWLTEACEPGIDRGVSCHAPYNASSPALEEVLARFARARRSIHVAESQDEISYIARGTGVMAERHQARGFAVTGHAITPVEHLGRKGYWKPGTLAVHLTQATEPDLSLLAVRQCSAAFCPSSNAALGNGIPPIAAARRAGLLCCLGTDSAISSQRLDMFEEMRLAVLTSRIKGDPITACEALDMATMEAARAIGVTEAGAIRPGFRADIVAVALPDGDPKQSLGERIVWQGSRECVRAVWTDGKRRL